MKNYYQILGVNPSATPVEVKKAFRILAQKYHPDKSRNQETISSFIDAFEAYQILTDSDLKSKYDQSLKSNSDFDNAYLNAIRKEAKQMSESSFRLNWELLALIIGELMLWQKKLSFASLLMVSFGLLTLVRWITKSVVSDLYLGSALVLGGIFLGYIAVQNLKKDYKDLLED